MRLKSKLKTIVSGLLLTLFSLPASAQLPPDVPMPSGQWKYVGTSPFDGKFPPSTLEADAKFRGTGQYRLIWTKRTYDYIRQDNVKYFYNYVKVDCWQGKYQLPIGVQVNSNGVAINSYYNGNLVFPVITGSQSDTLSKMVCFD